MLKTSILSFAALCATTSISAAAVFSGHDLGAGSLGASPNSTAAAAAFDAAVAATGVIDFEGSLGPLSISGDGFVRDTQRCEEELCGYNTTVGGSSFLDVTFNTVFNFSTAINAFGAYFTGVQRGDATLTFTDGSTTTLTMPEASLNDGGTTFFGFEDLGMSITSISYFTGTGGDFVGVDDIRYRTVAEVPIPASLPLLFGGVLALGAARRRKSRS